MIRAVVALIALFWAGAAAAHEVRPAYLSLTEVAPDEFAVVWKTPAVQAGVLAIAPDLPATCAIVAPQESDAIPGAVVTRWRVRCTGGLRGAISIAGLDRTLTSVFVQVSFRDGREIEAVVAGGAPTLDLEAKQKPAALAYFGLGVQHILSGLDHLAFVAGLVLIVAGFTRLLLTLTAFTLAHSLTLSLAALGVVGLPQRPVEVVIAFSIAVVAREAFLSARGDTGFASRAPWIVAFAFGLLHGFGFAGALAEIGLPPDAKLAALLLFNLGVEAGQILVVAALVPLLYAVRRYRPAQSAAVATTASLVLGGALMFWVLERLVG